MKTPDYIIFNESGVALFPDRADGPQNINTIGSEIYRISRKTSFWTKLKYAWSGTLREPDCSIIYLRSDGSVSITTCHPTKGWQETEFR